MCQSAGKMGINFTVSRIYGKEVNGVTRIVVTDVIDTKLEKTERVIFGCNIDGISQTLALKCMATAIESSPNNKIVTVIENEVAGYHKGDQVKNLFAEKYAHGRLWFNSSESCEFILMQKLSNSNLFSKLIREPGSTKKLKYLLDAFKLLRVLHSKGYSHGDCHQGNILWTDESYTEMKFIDPDKINKIGSREDYRRNLRLIYDLYMLLIYNNPILNEKMKKTAGYVVDDLARVNTRLKGIKTRSPSFFLYGLIMFDYSLAGNIKDAVSVHNSALRYPGEYEVLEAADVDGFLSTLTDVAIMNAFLDYMAKQIEKAEINPNDFDQYDLHGWERLQIQNIHNYQPPTMGPSIWHPNHHDLPGPIAPLNPTIPILNIPHVNLYPRLIINGSQVMMPNAPHWLVCYNVVGGVCNFYLDSNQGLISLNLSSRQQMFVMSNGLVQPALDRFNNTFLFHVIALNLVVERLQTTGVLSQFQEFTLTTAPPTLVRQF